jgi:hypothetical protein
MDKSLIKQEMLHYYAKKYFVLFVLSMCSLNAIAQHGSKEFRKLLWTGSKDFDIGDYLSAKNSFEKAYTLDSANQELNYKLGICKFYLKKYKTDSKKNFDKVNTSEYPEANYYLGILNHLQENYDQATTYFNQYQSARGEKEHSAKEINDLIVKSYTAQLLASQKNREIEIENIGSVVNTEYPEYVPLIPADEKFLVFTSRRKNDVHLKVNAYGEYYEDIYTTQKDGNSWKTPQMLDTFINTSTHDACTGLSADGEKLLLFRTSKDSKSGDILESNLINDKWSKPTPLKLNVNSSDFIESSACYSADNDIVFFSSNRMGGYGGKDLYYVKKLPDGNWGIPRNLGEAVNTEYDEDAPFVDALGKTLYFSSEGHTNMGGYDVFKSSFDNYGFFTTPQNLGSPINTVNDDVFFVLNPDSTIAYMSSERHGGFGSQDIYKVYFNDNTAILKVYTIYVSDEANTRLKNVEIFVSDPITNELMGQYKSNPKTGKVILISRPERHFNVKIKCLGYEDQVLNNYSVSANTDLNFSLKKLNE